jgi:hypothetical protein
MFKINSGDEEFVLFCLTVHQFQFWPYGTKTGTMILANRVLKLEATPGLKTTSPAGAKRA